MAILNSSKTLKGLVLLTFLIVSNIAHAGWDWVWCTPGYKAEVSVPDNSTMFYPKISVKETTCFGFGKYYETITLIPPPASIPDYCNEVDENGYIIYSDAPECKTQNCGTIMLRYCARYAGPDQYGNSFSCGGDNDEEQEEIVEEEDVVVDDPLDDSNTFVDEDGDGLDDAVYCTSDKCPGCRCACTTRLCAFDDPAMPWDFGDTIDTKMPFNEMTKGEDITVYNVLSVSTYLSLYYNQNVTANVGCVEIPLGPYPPPLCDPIQGSRPVETVFNICEYSTNYEISNTSTSDDSNSDNYKQISTSNDPCEFATGSGLPTDTALYSTFERPIVRLYFDNPVPLCDPGYVAPPEGTNQNDVCFWFDSDWSAEDIWKNQKNLLKVCSSGGTTNDCVNFPSGRHNGPIGSSDSFGQDYLYFRPYYSISGAQGVDPNSAKPYVEYDDPGVTISLQGIYDSYYVDMRGNNDPQIVDFMSYTRNYTSYFNLDEDEGDGMKVCIDEIEDDGDIVPIDCVDRPPMFTPTVEECLDGSDCYYNSQDTLSDSPRIKFNVGRTFTDTDGSTVKPKKGVIAIQIPDSETSPPYAFCVQDDNHTNGNGDDEDTSPCTLYSAKIFDAYLTDDINTKLEEEFDTDGSGPDTAGSNVITGDYVGGIQYSDYTYCRGGTKVCLAGYENNNKKVVAKYVINPDTNMRIVSNKLTDRVIPPYDPEANQTLTDDQLFDPDTDYWTSGDDTTSTYIAYGWRSEDGRGGYNYFEDSTCTSGSTSCTSNSTTYPTDNITCMCTNSTSSEAYVCSDNSLCQWAFEQEYTSSTGSVLGYKYTSSTGTQYYSSSDYGERKVNPMELGLCVEAAQEQCAEINEALGSETADVNGYASWEATNAGDSSIGTCVDGTVKNEDENGNSLDPIRTCEYIDEFNTDGSAKLEDNGCPIYSIAFGVVTNPCVTLPYPTWWPSQFIANNANTNNERSLQGAIFNMFNVTSYYNSKFVPLSSVENYDAFGDVLKSGDMVEDWYTTNTYYSCKDYRNNRNLTNTPRNKTDGDQEMLFLSQSDWRWLWDSNDLTWLIDDSTNSNGCWVYELGTRVKATLTDISVGMKICKYNNKVSFSLVETGNNLANDCTNTAYIMQSNIIAYDQYLAQFIDATGRDGSFYPETEVKNQLNTGRGNYQHNINHGIVINKNGFPINDYVDEITPTAPPFEYTTTCGETAEGLTAQFLFAGQFRYDTSKGNYKMYTYNPDNINSSCSSPGDDPGESHYNEISKPAPLTSQCALDIYRDNIDYSETVEISDYLPRPDNINPDGYSNNSNTSSKTSYVAKMYQYTCYGGSEKDSPWPQQSDCRMEITLKDPIIGNSARNPHMFYWSSATSYKPCNQ